MESAITAKGQATIRKLSVNLLGCARNDRVKFFLHPDGSAVLLPKVSVSAVCGMIKSLESATRDSEQIRVATKGALRPNPRRRHR